MQSEYINNVIVGPIPAFAVLLEAAWSLQVCCCCAVPQQAKQLYQQNPHAWVPPWVSSHPSPGVSFPATSNDPSG